MTVALWDRRRNRKQERRGRKNYQAQVLAEADCMVQRLRASEVRLQHLIDRVQDEVGGPTPKPGGDDEQQRNAS